MAYSSAGHSSIGSGSISMDQTALQGELERLHPASFGWALWCCDHRRDEAEEVLQAAYLKVLEGSASYGGRASLRTWFFSVVRRTAWEHRRRRWVRELFLARFGRQPLVVTAHPAPDETLDRGERTRELRRALAALPARQRDVLHLVFYQELTIQEAAQVLRIGLGTARTHFERGKARLRELLAS
jgi:RNA polymerase sigma factor (sigma-70 family)